MPKESDSKSSSTSGTSSAGKSSESQGGRGRGGFGASSASSSPSSSSDKGGRVGTGGYGGATAGESTGGRGRDGFGASSAPNNSTATGNRVGTGSYGSTSQASTGGRGRDGFSAVGGLSAASGQSIGGRGRDGFSASSNVGGLRAAAQNEAGRSMLSQGVTGLSGSMVKGEPSYRSTEVRSMNQYNAIENTLGTIRAAEARKTDPYNGLVYGNKTPTHANLTGMTIADVQAYQKDMRKRGHASTAVGAYQMVANTLDAQVKKLGFDPATTKFSKSVQDQLAMGLIDDRAKRATVNGVVDQDKLASELSKEWAGLATKTGKSHYAGVGANAATVGYDRVASAANDLVATGMAGPASKTTETSTTMVAANTPKTSFSEKYLNSPKSVPTPADKPVQVAAADKPKRSMGKTIAGIGLDAGIGLIPGVGMGASVINAGLSLAGKPTIGQMMVDNMGKPVHIGTDATGYAAAGGGKATGEPAKTQEQVVSQAVPEEAFGSKYLGWSDPTKRPTPGEKYGVSDYASKEYS